MALTRKQNWDTKHLHDFLLERASAPFQWQANDCCTFVADAIKSFTDVDVAVDFRGQYHDKVSAFKAIRTITGGTEVADAAAYCAVKFELSELEHPLMAQRGDLVVVENGGELIAGIVHLNGRHVVVVSEAGLLRVSIRSVKRAWRT
jgi:hypothetical protein